MKSAASLVPFVVLLAATVALHDIVLVVFGGILIGPLLRAMTEVAMRYTRLSSPLALPAVLTFIVVLLSAAFWYGGAAFAGQIASLQGALPAAIARIMEQARKAPWSPIVDGLPSISNLLVNAAGLMQRATSMLSSTIGGFIAGLVMVFIGVCAAAEPSRYVNGLLAVFPARLQSELRHSLSEIGTTLRAWLVARLMSMAIIGILVSAGLTVLGIPFSITLGALAGLLTFIPNVGAIIAAMPSLAFALAIGPEHAALIVLMYWAAHLLEDFIVNPIVERRIVHLPPALTIVVQLALGTFVGLLGVALAAPLTAAAIVFVRRFWIEELPQRFS